jgi:hypothetical protein
MVEWGAAILLLQRASRLLVRLYSELFVGGNMPR